MSSKTRGRSRSTSRIRDKSPDHDENDLSGTGPPINTPVKQNLMSSIDHMLSSSSSSSSSSSTLPSLPPLSTNANSSVYGDITNQQTAMMSLMRDMMREEFNRLGISSNQSSNTSKEEIKSETSVTTKKENTIDRTTNSRTYINCPYAEKDQAKAHGAKWDGKSKCWFIPPYITDITPFQRWIHKAKIEPKLEIKNENHSSKREDESVDTQDEATDEEAEGVIDYDSDEETVRKREKRLEVREKVIFEPEDDDASIIRFFEQREIFYPFKEYTQRYKERYTLRSHYGRKMEFIRSLFAFNGDRRLFDHLWCKYYTQVMHNTGDPKYARYRSESIDVKRLSLPGMYVHENDVPLKTRNQKDPDLPPHSFTLGQLPEELQIDPPAQAQASQTINTVEELANKFMHQYRLKLASQASTPLDTMHVPVSGHSDDYPHALPRKPVYKRLYKKTSVLDDMPKLEEPSSNPYTHMDRNNIGSIINSTFINNNNSSSSESSSSSSSVNSAVFESVLGPAVLNSFSPEVRATMSLTRQTRKFQEKELANAEKTVKEQLSKFDGNVEKAPEFLYEFCMYVQQYNFSVPQVVNIMMSKMKGEAAAWFHGVSPEATTLPSAQVIPHIISKFREQYMNDTHRENLRELLRATKMKGNSVTRQSLKEHYRIFCTHMNNLSLMDSTLTTETKINMFRLSLNSRILMYVGESWRSCANVDKLFQLAESAIDPVNDHNSGESDHTIPFNANTVEDRNNQHKRASSKDRDKQHNKLDVGCFHCGVHGHRAMDCPRFLGGKPQSAKGATLFAKWCTLTGRDFVYDPTKFKRRASIDTSNNNNPRSRSQSPKPPKTLPSRVPPKQKPIPVPVADDEEEEENVVVQQ
jgi:hypothetical protein